MAKSLGPVVVLTHNCEGDKSKTVLVADYVLQRDTDKGLWGHLLANRATRGWVVPGLEPAGYVAFRTIRSIPVETLTGRLDRRLCSMTADGRDVMALQLFQFLRRHLPNEPYDQAKEDAM